MIWERLKIARRQNCTRRLNCTKTNLHEESILHEGTKLHEDNFAQRVILARDSKKLKDKLILKKQGEKIFTD